MLGHTLSSSGHWYSARLAAPAEVAIPAPSTACFKACGQPGCRTKGLTGAWRRRACIRCSMAESPCVHHQCETCANKVVDWCRVPSHQVAPCRLLMPASRHCWTCQQSLTCGNLAPGGRLGRHSGASPLPHPSS
eukprot:360194-Chlamydomonas_euryale.AAC.8